MRFSLRLSTTLSATALAALLTPAGPANADTALLTCTESTTATYSPAIVNTPQGITVNASGTASCTGLPPGYTSATTSDQYTVTLGCTDLLQFPTGTKTYTWNNSATSTFSFTRINNRVVNGTTVVELIGSITAGTFQGAVVNATATALNSQLDACSTTGVSELDYTGALAILDL
ncbi:hypothetical protein OG196_01275 [Kitasatospora purpeofusca]|uniref:hypothetical protein n=1 Tax=Kitasatospora purpeofusca TaxID=67352 RepID=UPI002E1101EF|nr:hypothetical protein OG715_00740 [Kitasatospora purpeofusca]WSR37827.1 hypothetical protein OG196_01275 [Kitasatospora purpeofusca]